MNLFEMIQFRLDFEKKIDKKLLEFDCHFQDHMWDGYSEDKGQFITESDFEAIQALSDKIKHMILEIGCPNSVPYMLNSIAERKIKYWASRSHDDHGKQLRRKSDRAKVTNEYYYVSDKNHMVIKGHFRWNWKGYMISRQCADLLKTYLINNDMYEYF